MRSHKTLILEAELLASSPERVYEWLETGAKANENNFFGTLDTDLSLEEALLSRHDSLIDLGLARFTGELTIAKELFNRAGRDKDNKSNTILRLAVLSNLILGKTSFNRYPKDLFGDEATVCQWLADASSNELFALFSNPTLNDEFLKDFLTRVKPWDGLTDECFLIAVYSLAKNPRMRERYNGPMDGYAESSYSAVFNAGWKLAEIVPTTRPWANALWEFFNYLERDAYSMADPLEVAKRWFPKASDSDELEDEASANAVGHLGAFQSVRSGLAQLGLTKSLKIGDTLLANEDIAIRAAAYSTLRLTPEQLLAAYERDKVIAVNYAVQNENLWKSEHTRKALNDISWKAVKEDEHSDLMAANIFNSVRNSMEKKHPQWFVDGESDSTPELAPETSTDPATKADVHRVLEAVGVRAEGTEPILPMMKQLNASILSLGKTMGWVWWFSLGALVASFW